MAYTGLTWDHPRGYNALAAAGAPLIEWHKQPLEGFESASIGEICRDHDLVVLDHPHIGEAVVLDCLTPIDAILSADAIERIAQGVIGASLESYRYEGHLWALPLDAATQVAATRADLLQAPPPKSWVEVLDLSRGGRVAACVAGPHALLGFGSICVALGEAPGQGDGYVTRDTGLEALDILGTLFARTPAQTLPLNPIGLLHLMSTDDAVAYCPLVYGYVNYAAPQDPTHRPVVFADAPSGRGGIGSTLGGTGLAISRRAEVSPDLIRHIVWLMSDEAQSGFIPDHDGQPSLRSAWQDARVNARWGNFYHDTFATTEAAWVRPRYDGYIAFQSRASALLRDGFSNRRAHAALLDELNTLHQAARSKGASHD